MGKRLNRITPDRILSHGLPSGGSHTEADPSPNRHRGQRGIVVERLPGAQDFASRRVATVHHQLAVKLAALIGYEVATNYEAAARYPGPKYFLPGDTLVGLDAAKAIGIRSECICLAV